MLRSPALTLVLSTALSTVLGVAAVLPVAAHPAPPRTLVVDDDGAQCGPRAFTSIQAAVDAARRGDRIRICPGRYAERVVVDKRLSLIGQPAAVAALDCSSEQTPDPDDLDLSVVPVLEPPDEVETPVLRLDADRVEVAGLVLQGVYDDVPEIVGDGYQLFDAALTTDDRHSGWRIHHNLFRLNFLAVELGSDGARESRFDHNCVRDNYYAVANQRYALSRGLLDRNETFRSVARAWEIGWGYRGTSGVTLERNVSRLDGLGIYAQNGHRLTVRNNLVEQAGVGMNLAGGNTRARVLDNTVRGTSAGAAVTVAPDVGAAATTDLVVRGNSMIDNAFSGFTTGAAANLNGATIAENTLSRNQRSGILLAPGSRVNRLVGNVAEDNAQYGIRAFAGTEANLVRHNRMLRNGIADAVDETAISNAGVTELANDWRRNTCVIDLPAGTIC